MRTKVELVSELRTMLHDVFAAKASGETHQRLSRAHGYVDGFMRGLLDGGIVSKQELLEVVAAERERVSGPAMRTIDDVSQSGEVRTAKVA